MIFDPPSASFIENFAWKKLKQWFVWIIFEKNLHWLVVPRRKWPFSYEVSMGLIECAKCQKPRPWIRLAEMKNFRQIKRQIKYDPRSSQKPTSKTSATRPPQPTHWVKNQFPKTVLTWSCNHSSTHPPVFQASVKLFATRLPTSSLLTPIKIFI